MHINNDYASLRVNSVNKGTQMVSNDGGKAFLELVATKAAETGSEKVLETSSAILDSIGAHAPDEVKQAWTEAAEEEGAFFTVFGLYIASDGKHAHMTQMGVQRGIKWLNGDLNQDDLLGNSVQSAIDAVEKWIYDLDHPLAGQPVRNIEEQRMIMKERSFYEAFLDKLMRLSD